jgi:hypothetical protein
MLSDLYDNKFLYSGMHYTFEEGAAAAARQWISRTKDEARKKTIIESRKVVLWTSKEIHELFETVVEEKVIEETLGKTAKKKETTKGEKMQKIIEGGDVTVLENEKKNYSKHEIKYMKDKILEAKNNDNE